eukprot:m.116907 g.116907  ORF g.116907 m.116907 type:complete len:260 (-) comp28544_c1_seq1:164-943(-)
MYITMHVLSLALLFAAGARTAAAQATTQVTPSMFSITSTDDGGTTGCTDRFKNANVAKDNTGDWFTQSGNSIKITAGTNDCRTVNTEGQCYFSLAKGNVNQITFDFEVSSGCVAAPQACWLSFWTFSKLASKNPFPPQPHCDSSKPGWCSTREVDFIETGGSDLKTNFDGRGKQVVIASGDAAPWKGSITADFVDNGDNTASVKVHNTLNDAVGDTIVDTLDGYFFIMDTTPFNTGCSITVSNIVLHGVDGCAPAHEEL